VDNFVLITAATAQWHDGELIKNSLPAEISLRETTTERDTLIVTGPKSRDILSMISDADLSRGWLTHQWANVAGEKAFLIRVSFAGELGWEIHAENDAMPEIYAAVLEAGAKPFGMYALNSLRIEKGYRAWKGDLSTDYSMLEGGLERFVKFDKPEAFTGKAALLSEKQQGSKKRFVTLRVDAGACDAPYMSTLWHNGEIVGETTSGAWGYRVNASLALGMLRSDLSAAGTEVEVEIYGERRRAIVQTDEPSWDPQNERLRA
jgi:dimethylglycine dehydrogenase